MRKFIVICLMVAIGAVAFIEHASAGQNADFCRDHSNWPGCESANPVPRPKVPQAGQWHRPPIVNGGNNVPPDPNGWNPNGGWNRLPHARDYGPDVGVYFGFGGIAPPPRYGYRSNYYPGQCRDVAFMLRDQGFEHVRPVRCSGPRLIFTAWRDGDPVTLYVSRDGRIRRIIPNY